MAFVPVIPTAYTDQRQRLNDAMAAIVDAFILSEDYEVGRKFLTEIPDNFTGEGPLIVLGDIEETIEHTMSIRITRFNGALHYIDWMTSRAEYNTRVNRWADKMRDLFTYNARTVDSNAELRQTGLTEGEFRQGQLVFGAPTIQFWYNVQEGYQ